MALVMLEKFVIFLKMEKTGVRKSVKIVYIIKNGTNGDWKSKKIGDII
jgi:hypothetical protein